MEVAKSEGTKKRIEEEMEKTVSGGREGIEGGKGAERVMVPMVRLMYGEVAEATSVVLLPMCQAEEGAERRASRKWWMEEAVLVVADQGRIEVAVVGEGGGVAVEFGDERVLSWRASRKWGMEEVVLIVADWERMEVVVEVSFYLVIEREKGEFGVKRGDKLVEKGVKDALGVVLLMVRPNREKDDELKIYVF
ncbi:rubisco accumulation factor 1.2, chloroplastic-like [Elaeis guineensis]|uniref:rubisco accumulation factor 1.2, chloroplastic-like n=1 Tax=Elaeis guineensis var. tenera TaxID=51953 RepID=UPI003C6D5716